MSVRRRKEDNALRGTETRTSRPTQPQCRHRRVAKKTMPFGALKQGIVPRDKVAFLFQVGVAKKTMPFGALKRIKAGDFVGRNLA